VGSSGTRTAAPWERVLWTEGQGRNTRWCAALMKLIFLVVAGIVAPLVSVASPVISDDGGYYGRYQEGRDPYSGRQSVDPAGDHRYGGYGYARGFGARRAEGRGEPRLGRRQGPWGEASDPYDGSLGNEGRRPYSLQSGDWAPSRYPSPKWGDDYAPPAPDRFDDPYQHRPTDPPSSQRHASGHRPNGGRDGYLYPRYRGDRRDGLSARARPSYRFRGAPEEPDLPAVWWGGYRFRPLTDAEVQRMRSGPDEGRAPNRWPGGLAEPRGPGGSEGAYGYQPDGWFGR
jgi:hypothetical protein